MLRQGQLPNRLVKKRLLLLTESFEHFDHVGVVHLSSPSCLGSFANIEQSHRDGFRRLVSESPDSIALSDKARHQRTLGWFAEIV